MKFKILRNIFNLNKKTTVRSKVNLPTKNGELKLFSFNGKYAKFEDVAIALGNWQSHPEPTVRIHSECFTGDILGSSKCDCGEQLDEALVKLKMKKGGLVLYLRQEGRGIGLYNKLDAYKLQEDGFDTVDANHKLGFSDDSRSYTRAAEMLKALGVERVKLMTNNPKKIEGLETSGIIVTERIPTGLFIKPENKKYLEVKRKKSGHLLKFNAF